MLVHITMRLAEFTELAVILCVGDDLHCQLPRHFKPLGAFPPLRQAHFRHHARVVSSSAIHGWVIEGLHIAVRDAGKGRVDVGEIVQGNATFRQENESLICSVQKGISQQAALSVTDTCFTPICRLGKR